MKLTCLLFPASQVWFHPRLSQVKPDKRAAFVNAPATRRLIEVSHVVVFASDRHQASTLEQDDTVGDIGQLAYTSAAE